MPTDKSLGFILQTPTLSVPFRGREWVEGGCRGEFDE